MIKERTVCEKKIDNKNFNLKIGTTNRSNPYVIYIEGRTFIMPLNDKESYNKDLFDFKKSLRDSIVKSINNSHLFEDKFILDFQVAESGIMKNKKSFLSFQFLLRQNRNRVLPIKEIKNEASETITYIVNTLEDTINNHNFNLSKTKK